MKKLGFESSVKSPQEFAAFIRDEIEAWTPAAKASMRPRMKRPSITMGAWGL